MNGSKKQLLGSRGNQTYEQAPNPTHSSPLDTKKVQRYCPEVGKYYYSQSMNSYS